MDNLTSLGITWIDVAIIVIFIVSIGMSLLRGFVREAVSIVAWIAATLLAVTQSARLAAILPASIDSASFSLGGTQYGTNIRVVIAFIIIFLAVLILGALVNKLLAQITKTDIFKGIDKMLGILFGCARASVIVVILIILAKSFTQLPATQAWQRALTIKPFETLSEWILVQLPIQAENMSEAVTSLQLKL